MNIKDELLILEQERNCDKAIIFLENNKEKSLDTYLRVIFLLLDFLVDGQYTENNHDLISIKIKIFFNEVKSQYHNNNEFLFFFGIMIYIAEWYFGIENIDVAKSMLKSAMQSEPENVLYKWGFYTIPDQRKEVNTKIKNSLSLEILSDKSYLKFIKSKGLLGEYLSGVIQYTYDNTKSI